MEATKAAWETFEGLPAIFADCVGPEGVRYNLAWPFLQDVYVYATDGRVLARVPAALVPDPGRFAAGDRRVPSGLDGTLAAEGPFSATAVPLPEVAERETCPDCEGTGKAGTDWDADEDDPCDSCEGDGSFPSNDSVDVGPGRLAAHFVGMLRRHGVTEVFPSVAMNRSRHQGVSGYTFRFAIGDAEGVVKGLSQES